MAIFAAFLLAVATTHFMLSSIPSASPFLTASVLAGDRALVSIYGGGNTDAVSVITSSPHVNIFLFATPPAIHSRLSLPRRSESVFLAEKGFKATQFDLYPGSELHAMWSFNESLFPPHFIILRGVEAMAHFERGDLQLIPPQRVVHHHQNAFRGDWNGRVCGITDCYGSTEKERYFFIFYVSVSFHGFSFKERGFCSRVNPVSRPEASITT
ncbi:hypothetical protein HDU98_009216 [Podochytrium sp. JEL0797]|nr:hypothetical protein HDU98_009216 [Podochytrium sp. JEL0797]